MPSPAEMVAKGQESGGFSSIAETKTTVGSECECESEKNAGQNTPFTSTSASADVGENASSNKRKRSLSFHLAFLSLLLVVLLVSLDATALAVAIPLITRQLHGTTLEAFWASISFMLAVVIVQPIYTSISDILGRKLPLYAAFFFFGVGSIVFAVAPSMAIVILGRVLQGLGGGGLDVLSEIIVADITTLKERALYIGLLSIPMAAGSILGPILGALFSEYVDWRWIGWINLPLIAVALPLAIFFLRLKPIDQSLRTKLARLDWTGMLIFAIGSIVFSLPLSWAGAMYPWSSWRTIVPLVIGVLILIAFAFYEARPAEPVFPYRIFRSRTAYMTLIGGFIHGMVLYTLLFYLPLFFQAVFLEGPLHSAISMLPFCCIVMAFTGIAAWAVDYFRHYRWEIWLGWVLLAVGVGLFALWDGNSSLAAKASFQVIAGIGLGALFTVPPIPMQASAPTVEDQGLAVGILVSFRLLGALIGLAMGATTFSSVFEHSIGSLGPLPASVALLKNANEGVGFIPNLKHVDIPVDILHGIQGAYLKAMQSIWIVLASFGGLGFISSLFVEELSLETEELGRQHFAHESA